MSRYYTLVELVGGKWSPQFGDYSREVVAQEIVDRADSDMRPRRFYKIVVSDDKQTSINATVAKLNLHNKT